MERTNPYHPAHTESPLLLQATQLTFSTWLRMPLAFAVIAFVFTAMSLAIGLPFTHKFVNKDTITSIPLLPMMYFLSDWIGRGTTVLFYSSIGLLFTAFGVVTFATYRRWLRVITSAIVLGTINGLVIAIYY